MKRSRCNVPPGVCIYPLIPRPPLTLSLRSSSFPIIGGPLNNYIDMPDKKFNVVIFGFLPELAILIEMLTCTELRLAVY